MKFRVLPCILISLLLFAATLQGENITLKLKTKDYLRFDRMGLEEGLQCLSVSKIVQDKYGFLWFGTQNGLQRFDGKDFRTFENSPYDQSTISHNLVQTLLIDDNVLWVGTYQGMDRLDLDSYEIRRYEPDADNPRSISHPVVTAIYRDHKNRLWVGTLDGLNQLDESTQTFTQYRAEKGSPGRLQNKIIRGIAEDGLGRLWVATAGGLHRLEEDTENFVPYLKENGSGLASDMVMCLLSSGDGQLWAGTWGGGVSVLDTAQDKFTSWSLPDNRIFCLGQDFTGRILAGSWGGGLFALEKPVSAPPADAQGQAGSTPRIISYCYDPNDHNSLSNNTVYSIFTDNKGLLWIGTNGGGINCFNPRFMGFQNYSSLNEAWADLPPGRIQALTRSPDGKILISIYNSGLAVIDPRTGQGRLYSSKDAKDWIPDNIINDILADHTGRIWIATNSGLAVKKPGSDKFSLFDTDPSGFHRLPDHIFYSLAEDKTGGIWIGTYNQGLVQWNEKNNIWTQYQSKAKAGEALCSDLISDITPRDDGKVWVGTYGGLNLLDPETGKVLTFQHDQGDPSSISSNSIRQIFVDSKGIAWVATIGGGLNCFDPESKSFSHILREDGLSNNSIAGLAEYPRGQLWIATRKGLDSMELQTRVISNVGGMDGMAARDFTSNILVMPGGPLVLGHSGGLSIMSTEARPQPFSTQSKLAITKIQVQSGRADRKEILYEQAYRLTNLKLESDQNRLALDFRYLDYGTVGAHRYSWKLEGFDSQWSPYQKENRAFYTNLPPGSYTLKVRALADVQDTQPAETSLEITLDWPVFQSPLAWTIYAVLGLCLAGGISTAHIRRKQKTLKDLEQPGSGD